MRRRYLLDVSAKEAEHLEAAKIKQAALQKEVRLCAARKAAFVLSGRILTP